MFWKQAAILNSLTIKTTEFFAPYIAVIDAGVSKLEVFLLTHDIEMLPHISIRNLQALGLNYAVKFIILIALFTFVRGGLPRYRYDFLTKVGWIQMLNFILFTAFATVLPYLTL